MQDVLSSLSIFGDCNSGPILPFLLSYCPEMVLLSDQQLQAVCQYASVFLEASYKALCMRLLRAAKKYPVKSELSVEEQGRRREKGRAKPYTT